MPANKDDVISFFWENRATAAEEEGTTSTKEERSFDELAKGLANGNVSRRGMLRVLGGDLVGGVLASIPGVAWAQRGGGRDDGEPAADLLVLPRHKLPAPIPVVVIVHMILIQGV